ncbi:hypothetical protein [Noviherbaspirillum galbum]|uniref:PE-PGRS family protein n=1 Tax=Noviherbaspirillum galbum TaxID=2709383 RepID=A0A6B3SLL1_9BURK|nr:hypothetical protein [Noviherbaspirillum galbum]NEX61660.1 hypothetical protein [Noviherbaspirillum galbum]
MFTLTIPETRLQHALAALLSAFSLQALFAAPGLAAPVVVMPGSPGGYVYFPASTSQGTTTNYNFLGGDCYMTNTSVTPPAGTKRIVFAVVGGGGGGGGSYSWGSSYYYGGGGGGGSGYVTVGSFAYTGGSISISVGTGGTGGAFGLINASNADGTYGGTTTLTYGASSYTAGGGQGGKYVYTGANLGGKGGDGGNGGGGGGGSAGGTNLYGGGGGGGGGFNDVGQPGITAVGASSGGGGGGGTGGGPGGAGGSVGGNTGGAGGNAGTGYLNNYAAVSQSAGGTGSPSGSPGNVGNVGYAAALNLKVGCSLPVGRGGTGGYGPNAGQNGYGGGAVLQFEG